MEQTTLEVLIRTQADPSGIVQTEASLKSLDAQVITASGGLNTHAKTANVAKEAEHDLGNEANAAARAFGSMGEAGARATDRMLAFGQVVGSSGGVGIGVAAALIGFTALVEGLKSVRENTEAAENADLALNQALQTQGSDLSANKGWIDAFLTSNARFIDNQYTARDAIAEVIRAGHSEAQVQQEMGVALDLAAAKHITYAQALHTLDLVAAGNTKSLRDLGFSAKETADIIKDSGGTTAGLLDAIQAKVAGSAAATSKTTQANNDLNASWQNLTGSGSTVNKILASGTQHLADLLNGVQAGTSAVGLMVNAFERLGSTMLPAYTLAYGLEQVLEKIFPPSSATPSGASGADNGWTGQSSGSNWDAAAQSNARSQSLDNQITINNYGIQDPAAAGYVTAQQVASLLGPH